MHQIQSIGLDLFNSYLCDTFNTDLYFLSSNMFKISNKFLNLLWDLIKKIHWIRDILEIFLSPVR